MSHSLRGPTRPASDRNAGRTKHTEPTRDATDAKRRRLDRVRTAGRSTLATIVLALVVSSLFVAGAAGPVLAAGAPVDDGDRDGDEFDHGDSSAAIEDADELESFVDDVVAEQRAENDIPGAIVAVVEGDETVLTKGYGEADVDAGTPVRTNETSFVVGSVGKLVVWTAVMQGVENGELDLDEDVNTYLEDSAVEVPETGDGPVTLRHLGTHTDGFDSTPAAGIVEDPGEVTSLETALVEERPERVRQPGETASYSNYGAMLAGHVVAEAHDTTFEEYVQSELFEPLGMDHSTFAQPVPEDHDGELAAPHAPAGDGVEPVDPIYINWRPAGSMSATAPDMAAFVSAHLGDGAVDDARILESETVATMHDTHHERHPAVNDWRYGFYEYGPADDDLIAHSGGTLHEASKLVLAPDDDVGIFVGYNVRDDAAPPNEVVDAILDEYDLQSEATAPEQATGDEAGERATEVAGEYQATIAPQDGPNQLFGLTMRMSIDATDDGRLATDTLGFNEQEWVETEPYVYHEVDGHDVLAFEVENGDVEAFYASSTPMITYEPVAVHERTLVVGATVGVALLGFALSILGWIGLGARRRWTRRRTRANSKSADGGLQNAPSDALNSASNSIGARASRRLRRPAWLARTAGVALCLVSVGFVGLLVAGFAVGGEHAFVTMPMPLRVAFALSPLVAVLAVATAVGSVLAWHDRYWSRRARVHQTALAVLGLVFAWQLVRLGLLGG